MSQMETASAQASSSSSTMSATNTASAISANTNQEGVTSGYENNTLVSSNKPIPESFGEKKAQKPVPRSLGTDIAKKNEANPVLPKQVGQQSENIDSKIGNFAGTLLTEDTSMEYDELTGDLHKIGENIEDYNFDFDPNTPLDFPLLESFKKFAHENKMSIATAKKIAHFYDAQMQANSEQMQAKAHAEQLKMRETCVNDPEIGGAKFHESLRLAKAGIRRFDTDGSLSKVLMETGFGSHPEVVRFMHRVGKAFAETSMVSGAKPQKARSVAELFYPSMVK